MSHKPAGSAHKRKRYAADGGASTDAPSSAAAAPAPGGDLASWMRDVIAAPPAPEDAPAEEDAPMALEAEAQAADEAEDADDEEDEAQRRRATEMKGEGEAAALLAGPQAGAGAAATSQAVPRTHFASVRDLFSALQSTRTETLYGGLVRFHRQMKEETTARYSTTGLAVQPLLAQYTALSPEAKELFEALDNAKSHEPKRQQAIIGKIFDVLARMILPSSAGFSYATANNIVRKVVRQAKYFGTLTRLARMQDQRLVQGALVFMLHTVICCGSNATLGSLASADSAALVVPSGPRAPTLGSSVLLREFVNKFEWSHKGFLEIAARPFAQVGATNHAKSSKKKKGDKDSAASAAGTVSDAQAVQLQALYKSRQLFILLIVELLGKRDLAITSHLMSLKGFLVAPLKNLCRDSAGAGHLDALLHGLTANILRLPGLPVQAKFGFFNSYVLEHLLELFRPRLAPISLPPLPKGKGTKRTVGLKPVTHREQVELAERTVRDIVSYVAKHQMAASAALARRGAAAATAAATGGSAVSEGSTMRQHGPLLLRILQSLHANESSLEQGLLLSILRSFPAALLGEYLARWSYSFDPRPSWRWINHVALLSKIWMEVRWERKRAEGDAGDKPGFLGRSGLVAGEQEHVLLHPLQSFLFNPTAARALALTAGTGGAGASATQQPPLFSYLLPAPLLVQRATLSQAVQHASDLVRYTSLNMLRSLLARFEELQQEYAREWAEEQGVTVEKMEDAPAALQAALAHSRTQLARLLPDVQVLFGLRAKADMRPGQCPSIEEMQRELESSAEDKTSTDSTADDDETAAKRAKKNPAAAKAARHADSAVADPAAAPSGELVMQSRHVLHTRFLGVLASYARSLPEALVEGRIDVFKLLPPALEGKSAASEQSPATVSWFALKELLDVLQSAQAWKHVRLFAVKQQQAQVLAKAGASAVAAAALAPVSYFGQLLRLHFLLQHPSEAAGLGLQVVQGHEGALCSGTGGDVAAQADPARVRERVQELLTQVLLHTGLFSTASSSGAEQRLGGVEEIRLWLSSLRGEADLRFFELLVAHLVNSNAVWASKGADAAAASAEAQQPKLSMLLSTACSAAFHAHFQTFTPLASPADLAKPLSAFVLRFLGRLQSSPTLGHAVASGAATLVALQLPETKDLLSVAKKAAPSASALTKAASAAHAAEDAPEGSVDAVLVLLSSLRAKPSSRSGSEALVAVVTAHFGVASRSESSKLVLLGYLREAMVALLPAKEGAEDAKIEPAVTALWRCAESVLLSGEFDAPLAAAEAPASAAAIARRLEVLLAPSSSSTERRSLVDCFHPLSENAFARAVAEFLFARPLTTSAELRRLAEPLLERIAKACVSLAATASPSDAATELPFLLHLLQQSLPLLSRSSLESLVAAFVASSSGQAWLLWLAASPSAAANRLAEQVLAHGGARSVQVLAGLLVSASAPAAEKSSSKKSSKKASAAPAVSTAGGVVLERLLLSLLRAHASDASAWLSQLQPSFFSFCLDALSSASAGAGGEDSMSDVADGADAQRERADLFAQLGALFLTSEVSPLYVTLLVQRVVSRFVGDNAEEAASVDVASRSAELLQLLPLLARAAANTHLLSLASGGLGAFLTLLVRAVSEVFLPHALAQRKAAAANAVERVRLEHITELLRTLCSRVEVPFQQVVSVSQRLQWIQLALTGSKLPLLAEQEADAAANVAASKKKSKSKKKKDDSSDSDSDDEGDAAALSPASLEQVSAFEYIDASRFEMLWALLASFPASSAAELLEVAEVRGLAPVDEGLSPFAQQAWAQAYGTFIAQVLATLNRALKASAKQREQNAALAAAMFSGRDLQAATAAAAKTPKGLLSTEFESRLVQCLSVCLAAGMEGPTFAARSATLAARTVQWVAMLPLAELLRLTSSNAALQLHLLECYAKLFPSLLRFGFTSLPLVTLLRNALLWQLSGRFSRGVFLARIVPVRANHHFTTVVDGAVDENGEALEEEEVPSLLSICALAATSAADGGEEFQPLPSLAESLPAASPELAQALNAVPAAQSVFELLVSHSKFVSVIAPGSVARSAEGDEGEDEDDPSASAVAQALQEEYLRLLLLLFSFPDRSPAADMSLQHNLWLLLLSRYQASSTATRDTLIKLLLDLFEDVLQGASKRKRHKKMEFELLVSHRRWGQAALEALASSIQDGQAAPAQLTLTEQDPTVWFYSNFDKEQLLRGPMLVRKPVSRIAAAAPAVVVAPGVDAAAPATPAEAEEELEEARYDPTFVLPLLHHFLTHHAADIRKLVDMNLLGFVLQCMAHPSARVRRMAYATMGRFQTTMEATNAKLNEEKAAEKLAAEQAKKDALTKPAKASQSAAADDDGDLSAHSSDDDIGGSSRRRGLPGTSKKVAEDKSAAVVLDAQGNKSSVAWERKKAAYHEAQKAKSGRGVVAGAGAAEEQVLYSFKEYPQVSLLLTALKNGITQKHQVLPGIVTTFLARALPILLRPDHSLYKGLNRFLLARPMIDLGDIPLFYNLLSASSAESFRFARLFLLKILRDGVTAEDYALLHRRHVASMLMHFAATRGLHDKVTRITALQVLEGALTVSAPFLAEVVRVHSLFAWSSAALAQTTLPNQWSPSLLPVLRLLDRALTELRSKMPAQPEENVDLDEQAEVEEDSDAEQGAPQDDAQDEDMKDAEADGETLVADRNGKNNSATATTAKTGGSRRKSPLSPQAEALKGLRKRQRQRAQVARECCLLLDLFSSKLHEFLWTERLVGVAAPTAASLTSFHSLSAAATAAAAQAQPVSVQLSVVEFGLSLMVSLLQTAHKAHVASRRLTNRAQLLSEGRHSAAAAEADATAELDAYAPFAFQPIFLNALTTLSTSSLGAKLSASARSNLLQLVLLSSPTPVVPGSLETAASLPLLRSVADSDADVIHYFFVMQSLSESALARAAQSPADVCAFLAWTDRLLQAHPRVAAAWFDSAQQHVALSRTLLAFYAPLASASTSSAAGASAEADVRQALFHLNSVLARVLGLRAGEAATGSFVEALLNASSLSSAQRAAYSAAAAALAGHSMPLWSSAAGSNGASSPAKWHAAFASLLLQELWVLQLEWVALAHAAHGAAASTPATRQSAAFALLTSTQTNAPAAASSKKKKHAPVAAADGDAWSAAQAALCGELAAQASAFANAAL